MTRRDPQEPHRDLVGKLRPWRDSTRRLWVSAILFLLSAPAGFGQPAPRPASTALLPALRSQLEEAMPIAESRIRLLPACRQMFSDLGHDGLDRLGGTRYTSASLIEEKRFCRDRASAFTAVGHPVTRLCRSFARLAPDRAAAVLLHEALHFAGMTESPADPEALSSAEINHLVEKSCRL